MTRSLVFTDAAKADLEQIAEYIGDESGSDDVAESFVRQLVDRCRRLASLPGLLGMNRPELGEGMRSTPHRGYIIFFHYLDDR